jgi:hypothetical protein
MQGKNTLYIRYLLVLLVIFISGCGSMSRDECVNADWRTIGFEDGANGKPPGRIGDHRKACASHDIVPNRDTYLTGYDEGNQTFCTFERGQREGQYGYRSNDLCAANTDYPAGRQDGLVTYCTYNVGYQAGLSGEEYLRVCPRGSEMDFLAGYEFGTEVYNLSQAIIGLELQVEDIIGVQAKNDVLIEELQHEIVFNEELNVADRLEIIADIKSLNNANKDLESDHLTIDVEIAHLQRELWRLQGIEE